MILFRPHVSPASLGLRPKKPLERAMFKRSTLTHFLLIDDQQISASTADEIIYGRSLRWQSARPLPERSSRARSSRPDTPTDFVFFSGGKNQVECKKLGSRQRKNEPLLVEWIIFFSRATCCSFHGRTVLSGDVECGGNMAANCTCHVFLSPALLMTSSFNLNQCD